MTDADEFNEGPWWYKELEAAAKQPGTSDDLKRAVFIVVPKLIRELREARKDAERLDYIQRSKEGIYTSWTTQAIGVDPIFDGFAVDCERLDVAPTKVLRDAIDAAMQASQSEAGK